MALRKIAEKVIEITPEGDVITFFEGYCDSQDEKPSKNVCEGSNLIETDTGDWYFFNERGKEWIPELNIQE